MTELEGLRPLLLSISNELAEQVPGLRLIRVTSNYVLLVIWPQLVRKIRLVTRISIESSSNIERVWVGLEAQPLIVPEDIGTTVYPVNPPGLRGVFGGPFDLVKARDSSGRHPQITTAARRRIDRVVKRLPDLTAYAEYLEPNKWDDPTWVSEGEARAYCLFELGRIPDAVAALEDVVGGVPSDRLDDDDRQTWDSVRARAARSLDELTVPGRLEGRLDEWAQAQLLSLDLDPFGVELRGLWKRRSQV